MQLAEFVVLRRRSAGQYSRLGADGSRPATDGRHAILSVHTVAAENAGSGSGGSEYRVQASPAVAAYPAAGAGGRVETATLLVMLTAQAARHSAAARRRGELINKRDIERRRIIHLTGILYKLFRSLCYIHFYFLF